MARRSRWFLDFSAKDPRDPEDGTWFIGIPERHFRFLQRDNKHQVVVARIALIEGVVENPMRISTGWDRPNSDDFYVYVGKPTCDYRSGTIETPPRPNSSFLVFVYPDGMIDSWHWRDDNNLPEGPVLWEPKP